jgi:uncharacterized protein
VIRAPLLALLLGAAACDKPAPPVAFVEGPFPALTGRVVDRADLLSDSQEAALSRKAEALEKEVGPQYVIVTVPSLGGRPIADFGVGLGRHWGIGHKGRDDGVMLIVAPAEHKVRIEVGYGLERRVTDPFAGKVIDEQALPRFKEGHYPEGIEAASDALIARLRSKASDAEIRRTDGVVT